ncbi:MAG: malonic semialdehyde reductase [Rhodospirillaceae bacterium]|mgnify:CR=1 FL=1|jgi:3-hydroxypropanoate dehydrogenase|nr:malonic semialdehyde reductase [Rhodospirillaceae bacterium]
MSDETAQETNPAIAEAHAEIRDVRSRLQRLDDNALDLLIRNARSHNGWQDRPVSDAQLHELFDLVQFAPTANNGQPARVVFVKSAEAKARLAPAMAPGNVPKIEAAPVTAIIGFDTAFFENLDRTFPHKPEFKGKFAADPEKSAEAAFRNSSIQGAFFIVAARALGLDTGPMSGFNNAKVDEEFFAGTTIRSNFLCSVGYGDETALFQRLPRLAFDEICEIL